MFIMSFALIMGIVNVKFMGNAKASSCVLTNLNNHGVTYFQRYYNFDLKNGFGKPIVNRQACSIVAIDGDPNGWYRFAVYAQDTNDVAYNSYRDDD